MPSKLGISSHNRMIDGLTWSSPSGSPSPPPPPLPPPVAVRWARTEQASSDSCPHCRGRLASLPTRTTSLSSYSCKDRSTPVHRPHDDEDSFPVLHERELHSLHRNVPALRRRDVDTATIKQHYYPEGGWGWLVCGASFLAHLLTSGMQLAYGLLYLYTMKFLVRHQNQDDELYIFGVAWMGALCLSISFLISPLIIAVSRKKSTRLAAFLGGMITALACLFTSFAVQFHQALLSYGLLLGIGTGVVREASTLVLGHYFKRRREFVEMVAEAGTGVGIALFSVLYKEAVGKLGWRLGLQAVTGLLALAFFLPIVYRSANLYHPQRSAIMHLKNQRKKMKEKKTHTKVPKPPLFDFSPLKSRGLKILMTSCAFSSLGIYAPTFYLIYQGYREGLEDSGLVVLQTFMGFASALGCVGFGLVIVKPSTQCLISRQYLCQAALVGIGISLLAMSAVQGYHGYVLFVWLYGICLGGFTYSLKMFTLERIKARHFNKAWSFIQSAKSVPILVGIPITGYVNHIHPKAGYYFCFLTTIIGASLMFLVGTRKEHNSMTDTDSKNCNLNNCTIANLNHNDCVCSLGPYNNIYHPEIAAYNFYRPNNYDRIFSSYDDHFDQTNIHRHSNRLKRDISRPYLPKSVSYAANINHNHCLPQHHHRSVSNLCNRQDCGYSSSPRVKKGNLRHSKSVPEGLARWDYCRGYRRPIIRNIQVIEQITTSV